MINEYTVVDLFSGIGGLTHGLVKEGFKVDAGVDFDISCKYAFEKNNKTKFVYQDLTKQDSVEIIKNLFTGNKKILVGCAPCQAFSSYNKNQKNDKWKLLYSYGKLIDDIKPEIISMENVPQLRSYQEGKVFNDFIEVLKKNDYHIFYTVVNSQYYGVPQSRKRLILLASKLGKIELIPPTHNEKNFVTVRKVIGRLPMIEDGIAHESDPIHRARKLSPINKVRIQATPEGGGWRDWDDELLLECHKKKSGKSFASVYGRMKWDDVAPTLTTQCTGYGNGRFGHPEQDRAITLREAALLQTFPKNYKLFDPKTDISTPNIERHIGNAVPVRLGQVIAKSIKKHIHLIESQ
jgi:DNA (cytosine-5)-methyltransferase 1